MRNKPAIYQADQKRFSQNKQFSERERIKLDLIYVSNNVLWKCFRPKTFVFLENNFERETSNENSSKKQNTNF